MTTDVPRRIGVLTSGGDAQGMNAAVRAVVRAGIHFGAEVFAIREGYQGAVDGTGIVQLGWKDVSGIQHLGGTVIGTARSAEFRERAGRRRAAYHLVSHGIDRIVVIGGDGSLTGANTLAEEWPSLLAELVQDGELGQQVADAHPSLMITGIVGSIDNDMIGTDMTIGADSALHRIIEAVDAIASTAASHQRTFVVEVMGRRCGYLALTAAIAGGCDFALIPEAPPGDGWQDELCESLRSARARGRRDSIVIVAEGARDRSGRPITAHEVRNELQTRLGEQARVTILGHVQRGGAPSAFDRSMATMMGFEAAASLLAASPGDPPQLVGLHRNRVRRAPLMRAVRENQRVASLVDVGRYDEALAARGDSYAELFELLRRLSHPKESPAAEGRRLGILLSGGLAPGMNTAVRAATRLALDAGHVVLGIEAGFSGLSEGRVRELTIGDVEGWTGRGGAELGSRREELADSQVYAVARAVETYRIDALLVISGFDGYRQAHRLSTERRRYPSLGIPVVCLPATIDNNLPGTELTVGSDTAVNTIVQTIDRVKQSAMAANRCFVIETMGRECGYLAMLSALSAGAEQVYLPETGVTVRSLQADVERMARRFRDGRGLFLAVRAEGADTHYSTDVIARIFEAEGGDLYDVRQIVLGHAQQGGDPSPFDRVLATRLAAEAIDAITEALDAGRADAIAVGLEHGGLTRTSLAHFEDLVDWEHRRPLTQWWLHLTRILTALAQEPEPQQ
ncbi:MAG: 6-phosphofructokinase [Actinomycetales bacterium]|nr:6-phosphofructokinase [Actinomycetales bacterium]